jgi:hypothetical protein
MVNKNKKHPKGVKPLEAFTTLLEIHGFKKDRYVLSKKVAITILMYFLLETFIW